MITAVLGCDAIDLAGPQDRVRLTAVTDLAENTAIADGVPCVHLTMYIDRSKPAAQQFLPGRRYKVTIEPYID